MFLSIALRNLLQHRRRTLLLGGALSFVTALLVLLLALASGVQHTMLQSATTLIAGHVTVGGFYKVTSGRTSPALTNHSTLVDTITPLVPELSFMVERGRGWGRLIGPTRSVQLAIGGIDISRERGVRDSLVVVSGRLEDLAQPNTLMLFENQARRLGVKVGDDLVITASTVRNTYNTADVRVAAIVRDTGLLSRFMVFVPLSTLRGLYQLNTDTTGALLLYLKDPQAANEVKGRLRQALEAAGYRLMPDNGEPFWAKGEAANREGWVGQKVDVTTWESDVKEFKDMLLIIKALCILLVGILLAMILTGISNTLWISIRERTRELGTLRAIGMNRSGALRMIVAEGALLGAGGALLGVCAAFAVSAGVNAAGIAVPESLQQVLMRSTLVVAPDISTAVRVVLGITLFTAAVSLPPAFLAARLKPITAMHHVG